MKKELGFTAAVAASLAGTAACSSPPQDEWNSEVYATSDTALCVDGAGDRVDDDLCDDDRYIHGSYYRPYYMRARSPLPYYGDSMRDPRYSAGSYTPVQGVAYDRAPTSTRMTRSQAISRGGLGSSGRSFGGGRS